MNSSQTPPVACSFIGMAAAVPVVEIADDAHAAGVRRPDGEVRAPHAIDFAELRAELLVAAEQLPFAEQVQVEIGEQRGKGIRIVQRFHLPLMVGDAKLIGGRGWRSLTIFAESSGHSASYSPAG